MNLRRQFLIRIGKKEEENNSINTIMKSNKMLKRLTTEV
jgi:hypothetical protein